MKTLHVFGEFAVNPIAIVAHSIDEHALAIGEGE